MKVCKDDGMILKSSISFMSFYYEYYYLFFFFLCEHQNCYFTYLRMILHAVDHGAYLRGLLRVYNNEVNVDVFRG